MDTPTTPTKRPVRPRFGRSHSAAASVSPPQRSVLGAQSATKKLHLHSLHQSSHDKSERRYGDRPRAMQAIANHVSGQTIVEKLGSSKSSGKNDSVGHNSAAIRSNHTVEDAGIAPMRVSQRTARPEDVAKERLRRGRRDEELRGALGELSNLAQSSTRRLDNLFYSIVERVATLRSTIRGLQELSISSSKVHMDFETEVEQLEYEYDGQIDSFNNFEGQQERVKALEGRVQTGMKRAQELSDRLEAARKRVELWEQRENEWQAKTSLRLKVGWACLGAFVGLILIAIVVRQVISLPGGSLGYARTPGKPLQNASASIPYWTEFYDDRTVRTGSTRLPSVSTALDKQSDARLRKLDEL